MSNQQPPELLHINDGSSVELQGRPFRTIQGEGYFSGRPSVFVRMAGCNLQCPFCDTDYTSQRSFFPIHGVIEKVSRLLPPSGLVVITGGEPFRQNIIELVIGLGQKGLNVQIETNGLVSPLTFLSGSSSHLEKSIKLDLFQDSCHIVVSPKTSTVNEQIKDITGSYKYVLSADSIDPDDGLPVQVLGKAAYKKVARPPENFPKELIYVQPCESPDSWVTEQNTEAAIRSCMSYGYSLSVQTHKILGLP